MNAFRKNKFNARKVRIDGYTFDSEMEARRYGQLLMLRSGGFIEGLSVHPKFKLEVNGKLVCTYVADFQYVDTQTGETVTEDVKGKRTALYVLKAKLMKACHGIEVRETKA